MTNRDGLKHPKFGDRIRGIYASERNPQRDGYFVRVVHNTGRTNRGTYYECTDGRGNFWQYLASSTERLPTTDHAAQVEALEAEVARLTAPQDVDLCELASELEKVNEEKVIAEVEALTNGRTDPYWAGFSQACEEIAHRLGVPFKESTPESPT